MSGLRPFFLCFLRARVRHFSACSLPTECRNGTSRSPRHRRSTFPFSRVCNEGEKRTNKARKEQEAEGGCVHRRRHARYTNNGDGVCIAYRAMDEKRKGKGKRKRVENARATSRDRQIGTREAPCKLETSRGRRGRGKQWEKEEDRKRMRSAFKIMHVNMGRGDSHPARRTLFDRRREEERENVRHTGSRDRVWERQAPERCIVGSLASSNAETMTVEFNRLLYSCPIDYLH